MALWLSLVLEYVYEKNFNLLNDNRSIWSSHASTPKKLLYCCKDLLDAYLIVIINLTTISSNHKRCSMPLMSDLKLLSLEFFVCELSHILTRFSLANGCSKYIESNILHNVCSCFTYL